MNCHNFRTNNDVDIKIGAVSGAVKIRQIFINISFFYNNGKAEL